MSHAIYKTEAIILRLIPSGEASLDVVLFTREFGKIIVRAQSARKHESKMRMFLTRFRIVMVDIVRGRTIWRLTGIHGTHTKNLFSDETLLQPMYRIFRLAEFLIQGESPHVELFDFFKELIDLTPENPLFSPSPTLTTLGSISVFDGNRARRGEPRQSNGGLEIFGVIKVLEHLGYWNGESFSNIPDQDTLAQCTNNKKELVKKINESISATQIMVY